MTAYDNQRDGFTENPYFDRSEFACKCGCGYAIVDAKLLELLTTIRASLDAPITITSGARCYKHNKAVGGAHPKFDDNRDMIFGTGSQHLWGRAADIVVKGYAPAEVYEIIDKCFVGFGGVGNYKTFTHVDVRRDKARWKG